GSGLGALRRDRHLLGRRLFLLRLRASPLWNLLAGLADVGHPSPDRPLAFRDDDLEQDAGSLRLYLLRHLVGVELEQRLALLYPVAPKIQPPDAPLPRPSLDHAPQ